ncbi:MAG: HlyD family efflux transporter periplasmic adaptor subunit [Desulfobacteraceae bacterium]|nr:HlyD family efflux transporter periplasmic adaptor subunit [Desulfobacteraceae bacterium]
MDNVLQTWLLNQCRLVSGSIHAVLVTGTPGKGPFNRIVFWPDKSHNPAVLSHIAKACLGSKKAVVKTRNSKMAETGEPLDAMACPLFMGGRLFGVIAIAMVARSQPVQKATVQLVQTGVKWLETMIMVNGSTAKKQLVNLIDLVATGLEHEKFTVAATEVANELAERFSCYRVSLGFMNFNRMRVEALSHTSRVDQQSNLIRVIRDAMNESLDQGTTIVYPVASDHVLYVARFHSELAKLQQGAAICTVPLVKNGKAVGALMLERVPGKPFTAQMAEQCEQVGLLIGPVLETRRREERPIFSKVLDYCRSWCSKLFGPRHLPLKVGTGLTLATLLVLIMAGGTFRISCDAALEAVVSRVVVAPQQGYIAEAHVRAGDLVQKGDPLVTLDDRELLLEQQKWQSQRSQLFNEYRKAMAGRDRAEIAILQAKRTQAEAQLRLVEQQLDRTELVAPFAGLIVKGDLSQALGSPVTPGDVLYEVALNNEYKVVLKVDDRDIRLISLGQKGQLKLSGIPDRKVAVTIDRLTPVSISEEGRNYFRVEAVLDKYSDLMRPGMEGITKIEIGREKLIWIWTRRLVDWLRLFIWNRMP